MRRWLAGVVSAEVRRLRLDIDAVKRNADRIRADWARAIGECRQANERAGLLAKRVQEVTQERDQSRAALAVARALLDHRHSEAKGAGE